MDRILYSVLRTHNPWLEQPSRQTELLTAQLPEPFISRQAHLQLKPGIAELVAGPRQAGKTTWIRQVLSRQGDPVLLLDAEEPAIRELCSSPAVALDSLAAVMRPETILLFEEIQHLAEAPLFIKGLIDLQPKRRVIVTGSSSFQFQSSVRESLAGRARRVRLLPFSLSEVAEQLPADALDAVREQQLSGLWSRQLVFGGYPRPWLAQEPTEDLFRLVEAFVLKDASDIHAISQPAAFRKLLQLSAADIGNLSNLSNWAAGAEVSRTMAARYLEIAASEHLLQWLPPFAGGKRVEITGRPKVFMIDNGLRNAVFGGFAPVDGRSDQGALWENAVFAELLKRLRLLDELFFWRSKAGAEMDFVVRRHERIVAFEVKATRIVRPGLSRSVNSFAEAYSPTCIGIINAGLRMDTRTGQVPVLFRRPWEVDDILSRLG